MSSSSSSSPSLSSISTSLFACFMTGMWSFDCAASRPVGWYCGCGCCCCCTRPPAVRSVDGVARRAACVMSALWLEWISRNVPSFVARGTFTKFVGRGVPKKGGSSDYVTPLVTPQLGWRPHRPFIHVTSCAGVIANANHERQTRSACRI
jgi:hypothetical protein